MADSQDILQVLKRHGVEFVVIGGHAVNVHGVIRTTEDHDVVYPGTPENIRRLAAALIEVNARWIADEIDPTTGIERQVSVVPSDLKDSHLLMLITDAGFLDLFSYIPGSPGTPVSELFTDAIEVGGIRYASKAWLLKMKRAAGRPKDIADIENLEQG